MALDLLLEKREMSAPLESILTQPLEMEIPKILTEYVSTFMDELGANVVYHCNIGEQPKNAPFQTLPGTNTGVYALEVGVEPNPNHKVYSLSQ